MRIQLFATAILLSASVAHSAEPQYTRTRELPPLKCSFEDMEAILSKAFSLLSTANMQVSKKEDFRETLTIGAGPDEIQVASHSLPSQARVPKAAYALSYQYSHPNALVSSLRLDLGDNTRRLAVSGIAPDQVEAICTSLERDLSQHAVIIGGANFRNIAGGVLGGLLIGLLTVSSTYFIAERRWRALGIPLVSLLALILIFTLPFEELLAGFAVYHGESSFLVRFGPQISFFGVALSAAAIPLSYFIPRWLASGNTEGS